jgi:hypothetical protein
MAAGFLSGRLAGPTLAGFAVLCLADWVLVQDLGFLGGAGTDPNSMIPFILLAGAGYLAQVRAPAHMTAAEAPPPVPARNLACAKRTRCHRDRPG